MPQVGELANPRTSAMPPVALLVKPVVIPGIRGPNTFAEL